MSPYVLPEVLRPSLEEYAETVGKLPRPSLLQAHAFAEHVSKAHSWYKHLPVTNGYTGFCFYLDPNAGKNVWWDEQQGLMRIETFTPEDTKLHYSQVVTATAIEQFGYLDYCRLRLDSVDTLQRSAESLWITDGQRLFAVPPEVLKKTYVECNALLHPHSHSLPHVFRFPNFRSLIDLDMAADLHSVEEKRLAEIIGICNDDYYQASTLQEEYAALATASRDRQLSEIVRAIERLCEVLSPDNAAI